MNKLDDKVIIDKPLLKWLIQQTEKYFRENGLSELSWACEEYDEKLGRVKQALAADLTGWVAVPVKPTKEQLDKAICPMPDYRPDDDDFDDLEYEMASHDRHEGKMYWECLLEASPPLPGGGE